MRQRGRQTRAFVALFCLLSRKAGSLDGEGERLFRGGDHPLLILLHEPHVLVEAVNVRCVGLGLISFSLVLFSFGGC